MSRELVEVLLGFFTTIGTIATVWFTGTRGGGKGVHTTPEETRDRKALETVYGSSTSSLATEAITILAAQHRDIEELRRGNADLRYSNDELHREIAEIRTENRRLIDQNRTIRLHVVPIITWLDGGATPPPPTVHGDLRDLLT